MKKSEEFEIDQSTGFVNLIESNQHNEYENNTDLAAVLKNIPIVAEEAISLIVQNLADNSDFINELATVLTGKISHQLNIVDQVNYSKQFNKSSSALLNLKQELLKFVEELNLEVTNNINSIANNLFSKAQNV